MVEKNLHTEKLFSYIFFASNNIQKKFYNFHSKETMAKFYNQYEDSVFMGILFYKNRVFCSNIEIYSTKDHCEHHYLEITEVFNSLLKEYNIFHLCYLVHRALYKYYRENVLTEKILPLIINQLDERYKPKLTYAVTRHRGRYRLFIESYKNENQAEWNRILVSAIRKDRYSKLLGQYKNERPCLFDSLYKALPTVNTVTYEYDASKGLRKSIKLRRKRIGSNLQNRRFFRRNNTNSKLK